MFELSASPAELLLNGSRHIRAVKRLHFCGAEQEASPLLDLVHGFAGICLIECFQLRSMSYMHSDQRESWSSDLA